MRVADAAESRMNAAYALRAILAGLLAVGMPALAWAQREQGFVAVVPRTNAETAPLNGTVFEPVVRVGQSLLAAGILPRIRFIDAFAANPFGGVSQGVDNSGVVTFGADVDMGRVAGVPGGMFHVGFAQLYGHELSTDHIGSRTKVQSFYYPKKQFEMTELTYEQSFFGDTLNLLAGRANATGEFARSTYGCRYENVADCPFELTQVVGGFPGFPYVNWGGRVRVAPTPYTYVKAGAYEINSDRNRNSGFQLGLEHSTGFVLPVEFGYGTSLANDPYPRHYKVGGWYNSAPYNDPVENTRGRSRALFGGKPLAYAGGRGGMYALADQVVWRGPDRRSLALFASAAAPFDSKELFAFQAVAGALWTGPLPGRPDDQLAALGSFIRLSDREASFLNGVLQRNGRPGRVARPGFVFELNYGYRIVPGAYLQPTLQYLVNPDTISRTNVPFAPRDALVVGLKFVLNVNELAGLPEQLIAGRRATD